MVKILIVDDTRSVHSFIEMICKNKNFAFLHAYNGQEALDIIAASNNIDLVLLDWEMPIMNGPETLDEIMNQGLTVPVVMMTTKNAFEDIQAMIEAGATDYMMKPFTIDIMLEKIQNIEGLGECNVA